VQQDVIKVSYPMSLPALSVSRLEINIISADSNASHYYDFGIYDLAGNLVADTGPINVPSTGAMDIPLVQGTVAIAAGPYLFAITGNAGTVFLARTNMSGAYSLLYWQTATASSGGQLPATISLSASASTLDAYGDSYSPIFLLH